LTQGFRGSMGKAILIAGDVDFRPAVDSIARELPGAADFGREIRFSQLYSWNSEAFKDTHRIPREGLHAGHPYGELMKVGSVAGRAAELRCHPGTTRPYPLSFWITIARGDMLCIRDTDEKLIERYVEFEHHAAIEWQDPLDAFIEDERKHSE
jgi:hypothetical protein